MAIRSVLVLGLALALMVGCEKKAPGTPAPAPVGGTPAAAPAGGAPAAAPAAEAGASVLDPAKVANAATITGTITIDGNVPAPAPVDMKSKPECSAHQAMQDQLVVSAGKGLKDCFVQVKKGLEKYKFAPPAEAAVIDNKGCMYHPHVLGIQVGQDIKLVNSDTFQHNMNCKDNNPFNVAITPGGSETKKAWFKKGLVPTSFACEVHPWMAAKACVVNHPYWSVSDADGKFTIKGLPAGKYTIDVWHEAYPGLKAAQQSFEVEVKDGETKTQDFKYTIGG